MPFPVCVATDLFGMKLNYELDLPEVPSVQDVILATEACYSAEGAARRPGGPAFQVSKMHVVDAVTDDWVELTAPHQLRRGCQIYAFQPHSTRYTETQGHIPPATRPVHPYSVGAAAAAGGARASVSLTAASPAPQLALGLDSIGYAGAEVPAQIPPPTAPGAPMMPETASHDEKVRVLFEQIDANSNRVIEVDEMKRIMHLLHLDFSALTIEDLFRKADCDKDCVVNYAEWQRFCELYPTLTDTLYFRLKAHWELLGRESQIDGARLLRGQLENNERMSKDQYQRSQTEADEGAKRLADQDRGMQEAAQRQRDAEDAARAAMRDVDIAKQNRVDRERDLVSDKERERQGEQRAAEAAREAEIAGRRLQSAQQGLSDAETAERRAAQALHDAQRERERQQILVEQALADAQRSNDRHAQMMKDIPRLADEALERVHQADRELTAVETRLRDLQLTAGEGAAHAADAMRMRDELSRTLAALRERQEPCRLVWLEAQRALEDHDRQIQELEAALAHEQETRRTLDEQEKVLVEQEIRLREQRDALERKEGALREAHNSFFAHGKHGAADAAAAGPGSLHHPRASPVRSNSPTRLGRSPNPNPPASTYHSAVGAVAPPSVSAVPQAPPALSSAYPPADPAKSTYLPPASMSAVEPAKSTYLPPPSMSAPAAPQSTYSMPPAGGPSVHSVHTASRASATASATYKSTY